MRRFSGAKCRKMCSLMIQVTHWIMWKFQQLAKLIIIKACCMYQTTVKWEALQSRSDNLSSLTEWTTIFAIFDMCLISYFLTSTSSFNSLSLAFSLISRAEMWIYGSLIARHFPRTSFLHAVLLILCLFSQSRLECLEVKNLYQMFLLLF